MTPRQAAIKEIKILARKWGRALVLNLFKLAGLTIIVLAAGVAINQTDPNQGYFVCEDALTTMVGTPAGTLTARVKYGTHEVEKQNINDEWVVVDHYTYVPSIDAVQVSVIGGIRNLNCE